VNVLVAIYSEFRSWCIPADAFGRLRDMFPEYRFVRADSDEETLARVGDAEIVFGSRLRPEHLAAAKRLRWVHSPAAGVGNMLFPEMIASQVTMSNSRGNSAGTIAEHVVAVTLALFRDLPLAGRRQAARTWAQDEFNAGVSIRRLHGARMLVVGYGSIGSEVGRLASALGAHVVGLRRKDAGRLHEEIPLADVVVLSAPQTGETTHLIGERELSMMKRDSVLVNVSRGKLVDEDALVRALPRGPLRGAALDVFEHEPLAKDSPLWSMPNVLITPHVSGFHADYWRDAIELFADNLRRFSAGEPLRNAVDKAAGY